MNRAETLNAALQCVNGDREQDYGSPENNFRTIAKMWSAYLSAAPCMVDTETGDILAVSMGEGDAKHVANSMMILVPEAMNAFSLGNLNAEETEQTRILAIMEAADNAVRDLLSQMEIEVPKK